MKEVILGLVRHALTVGGTALAGKGYLEASEVELVAGAIVTLAAVGASVFAKLRAKKV